MKAKVISMIPTKDTVHPRCLSALYGQDWGNHDVLISVMEPIKMHEHPEKNRFLNLTRNRDYLRTMALASDAEWFLSVDSDTVLPPNAITEFMKVAKPLMGGWYKKIGLNEWVAARVVAKDTYYCFQEPQPGLTRVDMIGMGCAMIHRSVLEKVHFTAGIDKNIRNVFGASSFWGECLQFTLEARSHGFDAVMLPNILCEHIAPPGFAAPVPLTPPASIPASPHPAPISAPPAPVPKSKKSKK